MVGLDDYKQMLEGLSDEEKQLALQIFNEIANSPEGKSELLDELKYSDFDEIPVDIHTFLHDKKYLGNGLYDRDGRFTVFPF